MCVCVGGGVVKSVDEKWGEGLQKSGLGGRGGRLDKTQDLSH